MPCVTPLRLAVALDGAGSHPAARLIADTPPGQPFAESHWVELVQEAERGRLDFVTLADSRPPQRSGFDAAQVAAAVAPLTSRIGLIAQVDTAQHEPPLISTSIATLEQVSSGRAGWLAMPAGGEAANDFPGRAIDVVEAVRGGWDLEQPVVAVLARSSSGYRFAAGCADVAFVTLVEEDLADAGARQIVADIRSEQASSDRPGEPLRILADVMVFLDDTERAARDRKARLDHLAGEEFISDAATFVGTPAQLLRQLQAWQRAGIEGFRLRPGALPHDLLGITRALVPALQENDAFRRGYEAKTLRALLGLPRTTQKVRS